jgi:flagella basal body P-ring formation protein FlgA
MKILASFVFAVLAAASVLATDAVSTVDVHTPVRHAIAAAVRARMGASALVDVSNLDARTVRDTALEGIVAVPVAGARVGGAARFALFAPPAPGRVTVNERIGWAVATVRVSTKHARAARVVSRGTKLAQADLVTSVDEVGSVVIRPLPAVEDLIGARAIRDLQAGDVITLAVAAAPVLVQSGDEVRVRVAVEGIEARGQAIAAQSGSKGDVIRLTNPSSHRPLRGRVIGPREVEVIP